MRETWQTPEFAWLHRGQSLFAWPLSPHLKQTMSSRPAPLDLDGVPPPPEILLRLLSLTCFLRRSSAKRRVSASSALRFALRSVRAFSVASLRACLIRADAPVASSPSSSASSLLEPSASESEDSKSGFSCFYGKGKRVRSYINVSYTPQSSC